MIESICNRCRQKFCLFKSSNRLTKKKLEEQGLAGTNTSWDKEKQEKEAALARGEDGRAHRGLAGAKRTRYNGAQRHGTLTRRENQYAAR